MAEFEFQWGGTRTFSSVYDRSCFTYGPYAFGTPEHVDYVAFGQNGNVDCYVSEAMVQEWNQMGETLLQPEFSHAYLDRCQNARNEIDAFFNRFKKTNLAKATPAQLYSWVEELTEHIRRVGGLFVATQQAGTFALEKAVKDRLRETFGNQQVERVLATISQPVELDIINREQIDFGHLAMLDSLTEGDLNAHAEKHAWLFFQTYDSLAAIRFLKKRLEILRSDPKKIQHELRLLKASKKDLEKEQSEIFQKMDSVTTERCRLLQRLALERLELKNRWAGADWRFLPLFKQISKRLDLPLIDLINAYSLDDIKAALLENKPMEPAVAHERRVCYAVRNHQGIRTYYGKSEVVRLKETLGIREPQAENPVRGTTANPGKVQGKAYIVNVGGLDELVKDEAEFPEDAVMVVTMTQPNQLALVKKCSAIVADEGGSVSHAAVLARELGKPCIVGTKVGTRTFKTGEWIEVDADEGWVRKIRLK